MTQSDRGPSSAARSLRTTPLPQTLTATHTCTRTRSHLPPSHLARRSKSSSGCRTAGAQAVWLGLRYRQQPCCWRQQQTPTLLPAAPIEAALACCNGSGVPTGWPPGLLSLTDAGGGSSRAISVHWWRQDGTRMCPGRRSDDDRDTDVYPTTLLEFRDVYPTLEFSEVLQHLA